MAGETFETEVSVSFGHCDPAEIVFYPNFFRWFDAAFHVFLESRGCGLNVLREKLATVGPGLIDVGATFRAPVTFGDTLRLTLAVSEWRRKTLHLSYKGYAGERLAVEGFEVRGLFMREAGRLTAAPIAPLRALIEGGDGG